MWLRREPAGTIGLIAGQGDFPVLFAKAGMSLKRKIVAFGIEGCTDRHLEDFVSEVHYIGLGDLEKLTALLKQTGVKNVVLAGGVPKKELYNPSFRIDGEAQRLVDNTKNKGDDHLLRALRVYLKIKCGVSVLDPRIFLKNSTAPRGVLTKRKPTAAESEDLRFGWKIAKAVGRMDIGQTVVVKKGVVLAVEAIEGTDNAIQRGAALGNGDAVVVKVCKPNQDLRFDLPCIGRDTLETLKARSCRVLGIESGRTIMIFKENLIDMANQYGMTIVGM